MAAEGSPISRRRSALVRPRWLLLAIWLLAACALAAPRLGWEVVAEYPHRTNALDSGAFTQGLELDGDALLESSGRYGKSFIARWHLDDDRLPQLKRLPDELFAEGLTRLGDRLYLLTWRERRGLVLDADSFELLDSFHYDGEGWGLTNDGTRLIMSDGSSELRFLDPHTLRESQRLTVRDDGRPLKRLNELEWLPAGALADQPRLLANIWLSNRIVVIDPTSGGVTAELDLQTLYPVRAADADVLNGIAWDRRDNTLLVTGKLWPTIYRLRITEQPPATDDGWFSRLFGR
jgi:glutaminyl-peptide cyclotransferase